MLNPRFACLIWPVVFTVFLLAGSMPRLNAADPPKLSAEEGQQLVKAAADWLGLLEEGKYAESFAAAAKSFRKDLSVEKWSKGHSGMLKEFGAVVSRDEHTEVKVNARDEDGKVTISYTIKIKTEFEKKNGYENVKMEKESGEWKVADYTIETKL
jgi:hypothetical protein